MSQPLLVLAVSLGLGLLGTAIIAHSSSLVSHRVRAFRLIGFAATMLASGRAIGAENLRFNVTASMPLGVYRLLPIRQDAVRRGMLVEACAPFDAAELGQRRGYLATGACTEASEPLLKEVAAVEGDLIIESGSGVTVNGRQLPYSRTLSFDVAGRQLTPWIVGPYRLGHGQVWLYANNALSWDSRYWGPDSTANVLAQMLPILIGRTYAKSNITIWGP